jgi:hypothetical protein
MPALPTGTPSELYNGLYKAVLTASRDVTAKKDGKNWRIYEFEMTDEVNELGHAIEIQKWFDADDTRCAFFIRKFFDPQGILPAVQKMENDDDLVEGVFVLDCYTWTKGDREGQDIRCAVPEGYGAPTLFDMKEPAEAYAPPPSSGLAPVAPANTASMTGRKKAAEPAPEPDYGDPFADN